MIYLEQVEVDAVSAFIIMMIIYLKKKSRRCRRFKVRKINRKRKVYGGFRYYKTMKACDHPQFFKFTRMTRQVFDKLFFKVKPYISKSSRSDGISAEQRLAITLQYLSQGTSMQVLAWNFHCGHSTVHLIIHETCRAIWTALSADYIKSPNTKEEWLDIAQGFNMKWNFPNCLGALDGKHINIQAPAKSGSLFFNYKKNFSVVLLAACNAAYRFTLVDIGAYGSQSDGGIFKNSHFGQRFEETKMNVPQNNKMIFDGETVEMPYYLVADEAFPLKTYIMRPYGGRNLTHSQKIFNYRMSRARQTIENTFGILVARWRILKTTINAKVQNVDHIVKAVTVLHNYCMTEMSDTSSNFGAYCPAGFVDSDDASGAWREEVTPLRSVRRMSANRAREAVYRIRNKLADYLISDVGKLSWQDKHISVAS